VEAREKGIEKMALWLQNLQLHLSEFILVSQSIVALEAT